MPPAKKEQVPAVTPATIATGLAAAEPTQKQAALLQLAAAGPTFSTPQAIADVLKQQIPAKVTEALQLSADKSVKLLACRQLAVYTAAGHKHPLQQAVGTLHTTQVLWSALEGYAESETAIRAALADPAALKVAAAKKPPGAKDPADPDDWLPGPSKYLLEAALRALSSLAACSPAPGAAEGCTGSADCPEEPPCSWMASQEAGTLVCLLQHASGRVQMRALRLALQLARSEAWCGGCTAAGGVASCLHLAGLLGPGSTSSDSTSSSNTSVQLSALLLLAQLVQVNQLAAAAVAAHRKQVLDSLMAVLLSAGSPRPVTPAAASGAKGKASSGSDASKQDKGAGAKDSAVLIQQAAAELLAVLCSTDTQVCQVLLETNGMSALLTMLPDPPLAPGAESQAAPEQQLLEGSGVSSSGGTPAAAVAADGGGKASAVQPLALGGDAAGMTSAVQSPRRQAAGTPRTRGHAATADGSSRPITPPAPTKYTPPGTKLFNPHLQAQLLRITASVLSQPGMTTTLLDACPQLPRLLLHLFAAAPAPNPPPGASSSSTGAADAALGDAAAGKAVPAAAAPGAKGGSITPRGSLAVNVKAAAGPGQAGQLSGNGAATPRKTMVATAGSTAKAPEVAAIHPLGPPYAAATKAAALACLKHLCRTKQGAALLAAQTATNAATTSPTPRAADAPAQQQQDAAQQPQSDSKQGLGMFKQVLLDLQAMASSIVGSSHVSHDHPAEGGEDGSADGGQQQQQQFVGMLDDAAGCVDGLVAHLQEQQLLQLPMVTTLQALAKCAVQHPTPEHLRQAVMRALLALPEEAFVPPPRPPLPSPPPTPPPPPLATSQFAWDALDRPCVTDGAVVISTNA